MDAIAAMPEPYDLFVTILGSLGPRFGEGAALRQRSVDVLRRRLVAAESLAEVGGELVFGPTKTHAQRNLPLPPSIAERLEAHLERVPADPSALLFTAEGGTPLQYSNFRGRVWRPTLERLALPPVGSHVLRHSAAARMIAAGASPKGGPGGPRPRERGVHAHGLRALFDDDLDALAAAIDAPKTGPGGTPRRSAVAPTAPRSA